MRSSCKQLPGAMLCRSRQVLANAVRYRLIEAIGRLGILDDALIVYLVGDKSAPSSTVFRSGVRSTLVHLVSLNDLMTARGRRVTIQRRGMSIVSVIAASTIDARSYFVGARFADRLVRMPVNSGRRLFVDDQPDHATTPPYGVGTLALVLLWLHTMFRRVICAATGHTTILHFEPRRLALRCTDCGYETPGWIIGDLTSSHGLAEQPPNTLASSDRAA